MTRSRRRLRGAGSLGSARKLAAQLVVEAVMKAENITATDEQVDEFIRKRAERLKKDFEEYKKTISDEELAYIRDNLAYDNTVTFLTENAKLVAPKKKEEKKKAGEENTSGE